MKEDNAKGLVETVLDGRLTFEAAVDEHLGDRFDGSLEDVARLIGYANMGWHERVIDLDGSTRTVAEFVDEFGLAPFRPLLDQQDEFRYPMGSIVSYGGDACQVIGRRAVSPFATPRYDDYELLIEALESGTVGFVGEGEVEPVEGDEASGD